MICFDSAKAPVKLKKKKEEKKEDNRKERKNVRWKKLKKKVSNMSQ